jgi:hypothetical protein
MTSGQPEFAPGLGRRVPITIRRNRVQCAGAAPLQWEDERQQLEIKAASDRVANLHICPIKTSRSPTRPVSMQRRQLPPRFLEKVEWPTARPRRRLRQAADRFRNRVPSPPLFSAMNSPPARLNRQPDCTREQRAMIASSLTVHVSDRRLPDRTDTSNLASSIVTCASCAIAGTGHQVMQILRAFQGC